RARAARPGCRGDAEGARGERHLVLRRDVRHGRLPHGVVRRSRRERLHAAPPLRAARVVMPAITREAAAKRYEELPLPTTADEHWRFTSLRGFSVPEQVSDPSKVSDTRPMLDLDVAGRAIVTETGIEIVSAPDGIT